MTKKALFLLLIGSTLALPSMAQTLHWVAQPNYDTVSFVNSSVFQCKTNGRLLLVNNKGIPLTPSVFDSVTLCNNGYALALEKADGRLRIKGFVGDDGTYIPVEGDYYANCYSYFSEHLISVNSDSGLAGYLDEQGQPAIPCQYRIARPFIKGWASVEPFKKEKQTLYINHRQKELYIPDFHRGKVIMGSSFNSSGEALVAFYKDDNAVINTDGRVVRKYEREEGVTPIRTYDFAFDESGSDQKPQHVFIPDFDEEISTFSSNRLIGYKVGEHIIAPAQFSEAGRFANNCAIVSLNGRYGIVGLIEGNVSGAFEGGNLNTATGKNTTAYTFTLDLPETIDPESITMLIDPGNGNLQPVSLLDNCFKFTPFVEKNKSTCVMKAQVVTDGLLLWESTLEKSVNSISLDISAPVALSERANEQDRLRIQSVITNNSDSPINVSGAFSVTFAKTSGNTLVEPNNFSGKIKPHETMEVFVDVKVVTEETVKASVSVKANQKSYDTKSGTIQLKPFY